MKADTNMPEICIIIIKYSYITSIGMRLAVFYNNTGNC